jgi:hypothetical protein
MRSSFIIFIIALGFGLFGTLLNIYLGFGLTKEMNIASDQHLTIALFSLFFTILGGIGTIRFSKIYLESYELELLKPQTSENTALQKFKRMQILRNKANTLVLSAFVILLLSVISGTISQSGRFPLVHGLLGISLSVVLISSITRWIQIFRL